MEKTAEAEWGLTISTTCPHCGEYQCDVYPLADAEAWSYPGESSDDIAVEITCADCGNTFTINKIS